MCLVVGVVVALDSIVGCRPSAAAVTLVRRVAASPSWLRCSPQWQRLGECNSSGPSRITGTPMRDYCTAHIRAAHSRKLTNDDEPRLSPTLPSPKHSHRKEEGSPPVAHQDGMPPMPGTMATRGQPGSLLTAHTMPSTREPVTREYSTELPWYCPSMSAKSTAASRYILTRACALFVHRQTLRSVLAPLSLYPGFLPSADCAARALSVQPRSLSNPAAQSCVKSHVNLCPCTFCRWGEGAQHSRPD